MHLGVAFVVLTGHVVVAFCAHLVCSMSINRESDESVERFGIQVVVSRQW